MPPLSRAAVRRPLTGSAAGGSGGRALCTRDTAAPGARAARRCRCDAPRRRALLSPPPQRVLCTCQPPRSGAAAGRASGVRVVLCSSGGQAGGEGGRQSALFWLRGVAAQRGMRIAALGRRHRLQAELRVCEK